MIRKYNITDRPDEESSLFTKRQRISQAVQKSLDNDGELPAQEYVNIFNTLVEKRDRFINGNEVERGLVKREANQLKEAIVNYRSFRQDLAAAHSTGSLMSTWQDGEQGEAVMNLLDDEPRLVQKRCPDNIPNCPDKDQIGIVMPDYKMVYDARKRLAEIEANKADLSKDPTYEDTVKGLQEIIDNKGARWTDLSNIKKMIKLKDEESKDVLTKMGNNYLRTSSNANEAENPVFNELAARRQVESTLVGRSSNLQSLAYDEMIPGRTFFNDVQQKIKMQANVTDEQAERTAMFMINDPAYEKEFRAELVNYYTGFLRKQHNIGVLNRKKVEQPKPIKAQEQNQPTKYKPGMISASMKK